MATAWPFLRMVTAGHGALNNCGQLGDGSTTNRSQPVKLNLPSKALAVAAGNGHSMAVLENGDCWTWGINDCGQLADGSTTRRSQPAEVNLQSKIVAVAAGASAEVSPVSKEVAPQGMPAQEALLQREAPTPAESDPGLSSNAAGFTTQRSVNVASPAEVAEIMLPADARNLPVTLKLVCCGEVMRLALNATVIEITYGLIVQMSHDAFGNCVGEFVLKYRDNDGDVCKLTDLSHSE
eukprot:TRINITY_DN8104_c0_g1_i21.p1 TRINITY_DN8104_c0_g1~~TRINITY_DN8104_c0_g1_i21.p1  ORF type:complete len:237 (+),score=57.89 TRINITY_DN8104_c0_g1_i21:183-893(+)